MAGRDRRRRRGSRSSASPWLLAAYGAVLLLIVLWPIPVDAGASQSLNALLRWLHDNGAPAWIDYSLIESLANVALFLPFGLLMAASLSLQWKWLAVPAGIAVSVLFEVLQGLFLPNRVATSQDVLANGFGTALGVVLVYAWLHRKGASRRRG